MTPQEELSWSGFRALFPDAASRMVMRCFESLLARYSDPRRRYHNLSHIESCVWVAAKHPLENPSFQRAALIALWFHDAVYELGGTTDNELASANLFENKWASILHVNRVDRDIVRACVLATKHDGRRSGFVADYVVDVDLSILGAPLMTYTGYAHCIRAEYRWVPVGDYINGRIRVLEGFLARDRIYNTESIRNEFEAQARANIAEEIRFLEGTPS